jgi:antitoxin (DNA-binding transcriptional repressor) of toxin-antitoxin stability system
MKQLTVAEAKANFDRCLVEVRAGEEIVLTEGRGRSRGSLWSLAGRGSACSRHSRSRLGGKRWSRCAAASTWGVASSTATRRMNGDRFTLDANVLVYAVDTASPEKRRTALDTLSRSVHRDAVLTMQALGEFY